MCFILPKYKTFLQDQKKSAPKLIPHDDPLEIANCCTYLRNPIAIGGAFGRKSHHEMRKPEQFLPTYNICGTTTIHGFPSREGFTISKFIIFFTTVPKPKPLRQRPSSEALSESGET